MMGHRNTREKLQRARIIRQIAHQQEQEDEFQTRSQQSDTRPNMLDSAQHGDEAALLTLQGMVGNQALQRMLDGASQLQRTPDGTHIQREEELNQSFTVSHNVPLIPQSSGMSCWAASAAMMVGWRDSMSIPDTEIANAAGAFTQYQNGLLPNDRSIFPIWGMVDMPPQSYSILGLKGMIEDFGPLWFASDVGSPHARVITGIYGDGTADNTFLKINDPWPVGRGAQYDISLATMTRQVESLYGQEAPRYLDPYYFARLQ